MLEVGVALGVLKKSGAWFYFGEERVGQGKENARKNLETNKELSDKIEALVREAMQNAPETAAEEAVAEEDFDIREFDLGEDES